jgi:hypothetical protein
VTHEKRQSGSGIVVGCGLAQRTARGEGGEDSVRARVDEVNGDGEVGAATDKRVVRARGEGARGGAGLVRLPDAAAGWGEAKSSTEG